MDVDKAEIYVGQTVTLVFTIKNRDAKIIDLSSAISLELILKHPALVPIVATALLFTDGTDGKLKYRTTTTDLSIPGIWKVQADIVIDSVNVYTSDISEFEVLPNLRK